MTSLKKAGVYITTMVIAFWFITQILYPTSQTITHGFAAYYSAARLLREGQLTEQVYEPDYFRPIVQTDSHDQADDIYNANPPTTSLMFWPLSFFTIETARVIWTIINALMLWAGLALLTLMYATPPRWPALATLFSLGMLFQPALETIRYGQAYLLMFLLLVITVAALARQRYFWAGLALTLTLLLKTAGWALLPLLLWQKRWLALMWLFGLVGLALIVMWPILPPALWSHYWHTLQEILNSSQLCVPAYQTTRSILCQLLVFDPTWSQTSLVNLPWLAGTIFIALAGLTFWVMLVLSSHNPTATLLAALAWGVMVAPLGEQYHHTVMLIPLSWLVLRWHNLSRYGQIILLVAVIFYILPLPASPPLISKMGGLFLTYLRVYGAWLVWLGLMLQAKATANPALESKPV